MTDLGYNIDWNQCSNNGGPIRWVIVTFARFNKYFSLHKCVTVIFKFLVNSEANARRIAMVESCFGGSGQVSEIFIIIIQNVYKIPMYIIQLD